MYKKIRSVILQLVIRKTHLLYIHAKMSFLYLKMIDRIAHTRYMVFFSKRRIYIMKKNGKKILLHSTAAVAAMTLDGFCWFVFHQPKTPSCLLEEKHKKCTKKYMKN